MITHWNDINSLRIAKPVSNLQKSTEMYCRGLGLKIIASFENHDGFDGAILGQDELPYHFEMTYCRHHPITPAPTKEDLIVLYIPDINKWQLRCNELINAGFIQVESFNPYWNNNGKIFQDHDGYRIVLQNSTWQ